MDDPFPSTAARSAQHSLSERLRAAIDRLTDSDLRTFDAPSPEPHVFLGEVDPEDRQSSDRGAGPSGEKED